MLLMRNRATVTSHHRLTVDYKVLSVATDRRGWVRFEHLLSADWFKPVHVHSNISEQNRSDGSASGGTSRTDTASQNQVLQSTGERHIEGSGELLRQSSAWIEQIGSDRLPPQISSRSNRSRENTASSFDRSLLGHQPFTSM